MIKHVSSFLLVCSILACAVSAEAMEVRRFALLIGANDGGSERSKLRFAESDAKAVGSVLAQMGGVARRDEVYVLAPAPVDVDRAFDTIAEKLRAAKQEGVRLELIAYYSGHSDEFGLLFGGERYGYEQFRENFEALPADVRIVVVDSCASGALIRPKGGTRRPSFLADASSKVKGQAIVTSSSIDEAAQESDDLGSSYFTHFLVSGLRGAADRNADSRITLAEAYEYAFSNTLQVTNGTAAGAQHATYDFQLSGHGEVVLTMFTPRTSTLELGEDLVGRVYVWTADERLAVEVPKVFGDSLELGLAPGKYTVTLAQNGEARKADVEIPKLGRRKVDRDDFEFYELEVARTRGRDASVDLRSEVPPRQPWYRAMLFPIAGGSIAAALGAFAYSGHASTRAQDAQSATHVADVEGDTDAAYDHLDEYSRWEDRRRAAWTIGLVAGGVATAALLTEVGFRLFGKTPVTVGLGADGSVWVRTTLY